MRINLDILISVGLIATTSTMSSDDDGVSVDEQRDSEQRTGRLPAGK